VGRIRLGRRVDFWLDPTSLGQWAFEIYVGCPTEGKTQDQPSDSARELTSATFFRVQA
jgi:hypothetical protein